jgi:hypothetical protein
MDKVSSCGYETEDLNQNYKNALYCFLPEAPLNRRQ